MLLNFWKKVKSPSKDNMAEPILKCATIRDVDFGEGVTVVQPVNLYGCHIGDHSFIGPFTEIQSGARIGARTKIQSHTFICDMVDIGDDCFIGHGVMFVNDLFKFGTPARGDRTQYRSTSIGRGVSVGSNVTILPVTICNGCVIGAGSVVTKDLSVKGVYAGNPAKIIRKLD